MRSFFFYINSHQLKICLSRLIEMQEIIVHMCRESTKEFCFIPVYFKVEIKARDTLSLFWGNVHYFNQKK